VGVGPAAGGGVDRQHRGQSAVRSPNVPGHRRPLPRLLAWYTAGLVVLTAAGLYARLLVIAAPLAGLCLGPTLATLFGAAASAAPRGGGTETQAWINSLMNGGAAGGAALAGFSAGRPVFALGLAAATAAAAALSAVRGAHHGPFGVKERRDRVEAKRRSGVERLDTAARA
jgi:hypothetical protein